MRLLRIISWTLAVSCFTACGVPKSPSTKIPDFKLDPKISDLFDSLKNTCDKKDSELPLHQLDPKETLVVKGKVESMDIVNVDCDGKRTSDGHGPVRYFMQFLTVEAPVGLKEKVNFVQIENLRTCSEQRIDAKEDKFLEEQVIPVPDQEAIHIPGPTFTALGVSGKLKVYLSDSPVKFSPFYLNVHDKNNVINITYYGKCLKYKEVVNEKLGDADNCVEAEVLAQTQFLVSVQVDRPEVSGVHINNTCRK